MAGGLDPGLTKGWLPRLPAGWAADRLGNRAWIRARLGWRGLTADEYVDHGVPMLSTPDIKGDRLDFLRANRITRERYMESPEIQLKSGDVLLTKDGATIGIVNVVTNLPEPATVNGSIAVITPNVSTEPRYLKYCLASRYSQQVMSLLQGGMGVPHLFQSDIKRIVLPFPEVSLQRTIADFLDRETTKIDALIEKQQILIASLSERRQAVVDRIIGGATGMPGAPLRQVATIQTGITLGKTDLGRETREYPYLRVANVQVGRVDVDDISTIHLSPDLARGVLLRRGDVLMTEGGDRAALGRGSIWDGSVEPCLHQNHVFAVRPRSDRLLPEYLVYLLESERARRYFESTRRQTTNLSSTNSRLVRAFRFTLPSPEDQLRAVRSLDEATAQIAVAIAKLGRLTALSQERRTALINAAVTGQLDIATGRAA